MKNVTVNQFKTYLTNLGYSENTAKMLPQCLSDFFSFFNYPTTREITQNHIESYYQYLQERPNKKRGGALSESYIYHHIYALKCFLNWQQEKGIIIQNPISGMHFESPKNKAREILTLHEIERLYDTCQTIKEKATLSVFYGCGLRRSEAEKLNLRDVHFKSSLLYVREGKNRKRRAVPLSDKVKAHLRDYVKQDRKYSLKTPGESAFMLNSQGKRMPGDTYLKTIKKLVKRAEIDKNITLHGLRHSIATHLLELGLPVEDVRDFLGHKHLEATQIYTHVQADKIWNTGIT